MHRLEGIDARDNVAVADAAADRALQSALGEKVPQFRDVLVDYALSLKVSHGVTSPEFAVTAAMPTGTGLDLFEKEQIKNVHSSPCRPSSVSPVR